MACLTTTRGLTGSAQSGYSLTFGSRDMRIRLDWVPITPLCSPIGDGKIGRQLESVFRLCQSFRISIEMALA